MRVLLVVGVVCAGCTSGLPTGDAGSGNDRDATEGCIGVPERLASVTCDEPTLGICPSTAELSRSSISDTCQPGTSRGGVATLSCGGFEVVAHTAPRSTFECFYGADGGALSGVLHFTETGVFAFGSVADCNRTEPIPCVERCSGFSPALNAVVCHPSPGDCGAMAEQMRADTTTCDSATHFGAISTQACGGLEVVTRKTAPLGIITQCFFEPDGGGLSGSLSFTDTSIGAYGHVAQCAAFPPLECEGQCAPFPPNVQASCVPDSRFSSCGASIQSVASFVAVDCDAPHGVLGYAAEGSCGDLKSFRWTYAQTGDTRECFFAVDGGAFVGGLDFTDGGVFAAGTTASCTWSETAACRDGGR
ncbi:MAG: hypothetical protein ACO1OB_32100 [Archangium sp.]